MQVHVALDDVLSNRTRLRVLRVLVSFPRKEFTGRELSRLARASLAPVQEALRGLHRAGVVERRTVGRANQWRFVEANVLGPAFRDLFRAEASLLESLRIDLARGLARVPVRSAHLFGSVAQGRERPDSDVDLLIEVPDQRTRERVDRLLEPLVVEVGRRYGMRLSPIVVSTSRKNRLNPNVLKDVTENGLWVAGTEGERR